MLGLEQRQKCRMTIQPSPQETNAALEHLRTADIVLLAVPARAPQADGADLMHADVASVRSSATMHTAVRQRWRFLVGLHRVRRRRRRRL